MHEATPKGRSDEDGNGAAEIIFWDEPEVPKLPDRFLTGSFVEAVDHFKRSILYFDDFAKILHAEDYDSSPELTIKRVKVFFGRSESRIRSRLKGRDLSLIFGPLSKSGMPTNQTRFVGLPIDSGTKVEDIDDSTRPNPDELRDFAKELRQRADDFRAKWNKEDERKDNHAMKELEALSARAKRLNKNRILVDLINEALFKVEIALGVDKYLSTPNELPTISPPNSEQVVLALKEAHKFGVITKEELENRQLSVASFIALLLLKNPSMRAKLIVDDTREPMLEVIRLRTNQMLRHWGYKIPEPKVSRMPDESGTDKAT